MRGRAAKKKSDSMDLLLDTICNTFGGVLFIALLVVMLVQTSPANLEATRNEAADRDRHDLLTQELASLNDEMDRLEAALSGQLRTLGALAPEELRQLLTDRAQKAEQAAALRAEASRLEALNSSISEESAADRESSSNVKANLKRALAEVERLEKELKQLKDSKVKELRTPVARPPGLKSEVGLVIKYGRLYVWHRYDRFGNRRGLNTDDFLITQHSVEGIETTPRPTRGIPIMDSPQSRAEIASVLRQFSPTRHYPHFLVRPDSFDEFPIVRDVALELGFEYRLMPLEAESAVFDRGGRGGRVQ